VFFIPLEKENPTIKKPWLVYGLIALNGLVFFLSVIQPSFSDFILRYGFVPAGGRIVTVFTSMFLHGSLMHLAGNMFFLWMFGDNIEDVLGKPLFLLSYLASGFCAALVLYLSNPASTVPCIGASGAVSGVLGLYMVFYPRVRVDLVLTYAPVRKAGIKTTALIGLGLWFFAQFLVANILQATGTSEYVGIAFWAHVGGFIGGCMLAYYFILLGVKRRFDHKLDRLAANKQLITHKHHGRLKSEEEEDEIREEREVITQNEEVKEVAPEEKLEEAPEEEQEELEEELEEELAEEELEEEPEEGLEEESVEEPEEEQEEELEEELEEESEEPEEEPEEESETSAEAETATDETKYCQACGGELWADAKSCDDCGAACLDWAYSGAMGEDHWGELAGDCGSGGMQSPIDIVSDELAETSELAPLVFEYAENVDLDFFHNGATIRANLPSGVAGIKLEEERYDLVQLHFHAPSEHHIDGEEYPLEVHLVHRSVENKLCVVSVLAEVGESKMLTELFDDLPAQPGGRQMIEDVYLDDLLPEELGSYRYLGSLTTPPCTERVYWVVMGEPVKFSQARLNAFQELFSGEDFPQGNRRSLQPLNDRAISTDIEFTWEEE